MKSASNMREMEYKNDNYFTCNLIKSITDHLNLIEYINMVITVVQSRIEM